MQKGPRLSPKVVANQPAASDFLGHELKAPQISCPVFGVAVPCGRDGTGVGFAVARNATMSARLFSSACLRAARSAVIAMA